MKDVNSDGYAWSVPVRVIRTLVEEALDRGFDALYLKVIDPQTRKPVDTARFKLFANNGGRHPGGPHHKAGEQIKERWIDDFPPIPPGP